MPTQEVNIKKEVLKRNTIIEIIIQRGEEDYLDDTTHQGVTEATIPIIRVKLVADAEDQDVTLIIAGQRMLSVIPVDK